MICRVQPRRQDADMPLSYACAEIWNNSHYYVCGWRGRIAMVFLWSVLLGIAGLLAAGAAYTWRVVEYRSSLRARLQCEQERAAGTHLCISTIESLATALEAQDP